MANSARYAAVYSSFAIVIVFLIWLYTGWLIFLIGAEVAYFHQYPSAFLYEAMTDGKGYRSQEWLALSTLAEVAGRHLSHRPPWEETELAARLGVSSLGNLIDEFVRSGILLRSAEPEGVALARPPENIFVKDILEIVGGSTTHEKGAISDVYYAVIKRPKSPGRDHTEVLGRRKSRNSAANFLTPNRLLRRAEQIRRNNPMMINHNGIMADAGPECTGSSTPAEWASHNRPI